KLESHYGQSIEDMNESWSCWVKARGVGTHEPPPPALRTAIDHRLLSLLEDQHAPAENRIRAARALGEFGFAYGADRLIEALVRGDETLRDDAVWSLEMISGFCHGEDVASWRAWWDELPAKAIA